MPPQAGGLTIAYTTQGGACDSYKIHGWDYFGSADKSKNNTPIHHCAQSEGVRLKKKFVE
jgi:hypothetical protein